MKQLASYVSRSLLGAMLLMLVLLLGLELVFAFLGEVEDLKGGYTATEALIYIGLTAPRRAYDLLPIAALVGGIVGLGMMASASELTVMRAAGVSIGRIVWWVMRPALVLVLAGLLLGQYVVPKTERLAEARRAEAQGHNYMAGWLNSYWHREGDDIVRIGRVDPSGALSDLVFFRISADGRLRESSRAGAAQFTGQGWQLDRVRETRFLPDGRAEVVKIDARFWPSRLTPDFLRLVTLDPEILSLSNLYRYARYMKQQGLDSGAYFLEFWKKTLAPFATLSMVLIACSFIFGPLRSVTMGLRILAGVLAGLLFRYTQDFLGYVSLVYDFSPALAAGLPIAVCLLVGSVAIARVR
jgi:lipopolysaccharide export system permease protein